MAEIEKVDWPFVGATLEEAAAALRVHKRTLMEHIRDRPDFPARKIGRAWRLDLDAVKVWLNGHDESLTGDSEEE